MFTRKRFVPLILFLENEIASFFIVDAKLQFYSELCTGEKADCMDKDNEDWTPSIGLPDHVKNDENDFPDSMPNPQSDWDQLEFDHTLIHKETARIKEIHTSMLNCEETMHFAQ